MRAFIKSFYVMLVMTISSLYSFAQTSPIPAKRLPIIDVHVHAMKMGNNKVGDLCPWFLRNMNGTDPLKPEMNFMATDCIDPLKAAASDKEWETAMGERMDKNVTMVMSGDALVIHSLYNGHPKNVIPSIGLDMPLKAFEDSIKTGFYKVIGEFAPQYAGKSPSDTMYDAYFDIAEKYNIPVGIHMGTGGNGMANLTSPKFRASLGNPFLLEDLLAKHPKLKIWVMHAGYPMMDEMLALMGANAYVYVDIAGFIWSYPLEEVNNYIKRLVQAGFGKRVMYGTDLMIWPKLFETSVGVVENADYLSQDQKRDILFNNAVRFFRLDEKQFK
jgi:hypothetical protein